VPGQPVERKLAAIFAADIAGYSRLMARDEVGTLARLKACRSIVDHLIASHRGRIFNTAGDSVVADFASAVDAVQCAVAVQAAIAIEDAGGAADEPMQLRIGVHVGDVMVDGDNLLGDGVNIAARLEALAEPGAICVSATARDHIGNKLPLGFDDLGEQQTKNIPGAIRVYRVQTEMPVAQPAATLPLPDKPSIAVLAFANMSGDPEQEYFADGMVEEIITALSRIRWLFVIARNSSFTYKGQAVDVKQVGRELGVRYVLEGSVRKGGSRVRITAQLIDAISGAHLWAERYDRDLTNIFAVQDEITASVAGVIEPALAEAEQQRVLRKPPENLDAWEAYQRGLWHFYKYGAEDNKSAQNFFRQAMALDPNFGPGHYGYSLALQWDVWHYYSTRAVYQVQESALEEARIAVSLDDKDAMAHAVLAHMRVWCGEWEAAIAEARTALVLNPNSAFVISTLGCVLGFGGYRDEAIDRLQQAMRASPHDPLTWLWTFWIGLFRYFRRDFDSSLDAMREVVRMRPGFPSPHQQIAYALAMLGRTGEAAHAITRATAAFPSQLARTKDRSPWQRPADFALLREGRRLSLAAAGLPDQ
jgi:adenylate cyclase